MFRPRSRPGRLAFALTAMLAGCSTVQVPATDFDIAGPGESVALLRIGLTGPVGTDPIAEARFWSLAKPEARGFVQRWAFSARPSTGLLGSDAWISVPLPPGRHLLELRALPGGRSLHQVVIPPGQGSVYLGTFARVCDPQGTGCRMLPPTAEDAAAAQGVVPEAHRAAFGARVALAQPYPPTLRALGLAAPLDYAVTVDPAAWLTAVDWDAMLPQGAQAHPAQEQRLGKIVLGGRGDELLLGLAVMVLLLPVALIGLAIVAERDRADRQREEERQARLQQLRAALSPCEATIAAALTPERVEAQLRQAAPAPGGGGRAPRASAARPDRAWQASVDRVVLRRCGDGPDSFGVEVASRWTARQPGQVEPLFDVRYSRWVEGATPDNRLRFSERPPWEVPVLPDAACRPLAAWCGDGGAALLDEVLRSVTSARDAIAATR
jgi:hypothetical protein